LPIITQAEARQAIPTLTSDDTTLAAYITRVEQAIARYLHFPAPAAGGSPLLLAYAVVLYNDMRAGDMRVDGRHLLLGVRPVSSVHVYQDTSEAFAADTEVDSGEYTVDTERGILRLDVDSSTSWLDIEYAMKVTCNVGWSSIPDDVKAAAIETVAHLWRRRGIGATDQGGKDDDVAIPDAAKDLLAPHRLVSGWVS
jgi:hypothetical protein